jgi:hypothetical protein
VKGIVSPAAASTGTIRVLSYWQLRQGRLRVDVRGTTPGAGHDRLEVVGGAILDGRLDIVRAPAFTPGAADRLKIVTAQSRDRGFRKIVGAPLLPARAFFAAYTPTAVDLRTMTSFAGVDQTTPGAWYPPDTTIAVTDRHVIEATNRVVRLMTRGGVEVRTETLKTFFNARVPNAEGDLFDPKVIFDRMGPNRRVYLLALQQTSSTSRIWLATSRSSDPASLKHPDDWCLYEIDAKSRTPEPGWADFPGLAAGQRSLVVTTNQMAFAPERFLHAEVRVLNKAALANNAASCPRLPVIRKLRPTMNNQDRDAMSLAPVQALTPPTGTGSTVFLLSANDVPSSTYRVWRISGTPAGPSMSSVPVSGGPHLQRPT